MCACARTGGGRLGRCIFLLKGDKPVDHYTLADLLAHWERGELTLQELIAQWPYDDAINDELLRELLRALVGVLWRVMELEAADTQP